MIAAILARLAVAVVWVIAVSAQGYAPLPACAQSCALNSIPQECQNNAQCICSASSFIEGITCCVAKACGPQDQEQTIRFAQRLCGGAGVTNLPSSATCASTASSTGSAATSGASSATGSSSLSTSTSASSTAASAASSSGSTAAAAATNTGAANSLAVQRFGVVGAAVVGAVALM